jgi:DNA polymerase-3 subunit delta
LLDLARAIDRGSLGQMLGTLALYARGQPQVDAAEVLAVAPLTREAEAEDLMEAVALGRAGAVAPLLGRLQAQGLGPTGVAIAAIRHFRALVALAGSPDGAEAAAGRLRPPVWGKTRERLIAQTRSMGRARIERALGDLVECDLTLRSAAKVPQEALIERVLLRIASTAARGG